MRGELFMRWKDRPLLRGACGGLLLTFLYSLAFVIYAVIRSSLAIIGAEPRAMTEGLLANAVSLLVSTVGISLLVSVPAVLFGMLGSFLVDRPLRRLPPDAARMRGASIGAGTAFVVLLILHLALGLGLGFSIGLVPAETYWFWLGIPSAIYIAFFGMVGWYRGIPSRGSVPAGKVSDDSRPRDRRQTVSGVWSYLSRP